MPSLTINTNIPKSKFSDDFCANMTKVIAQTLSKPESYCVVHVIPDQILTWNGTNDPCANCSLVSIGKLGIEENKRHSKAIMSELNKLGIPSDRIYIQFIDPKPSDMGYNNSTFHDDDKPVFIPPHKLHLYTQHTSTKQSPVLSQQSPIHNSIEFSYSRPIPTFTQPQSNSEQDRSSVNTINSESNQQELFSKKNEYLNETNYPTQSINTNEIDNNISQSKNLNTLSQHGMQNQNFNEGFQENQNISTTQKNQNHTSMNLSQHLSSPYQETHNDSELLKNQYISTTQTNQIRINTPSPQIEPKGSTQISKNPSNSKSAKNSVLIGSNQSRTESAKFPQNNQPRVDNEFSNKLISSDSANQINNLSRNQSSTPIFKPDYMEDDQRYNNNNNLSNQTKMVVPTIIDDRNFSANHNRLKSSTLSNQPLSPSSPLHEQQQSRLLNPVNTLSTTYNNTNNPVEKLDTRLSEQDTYLNEPNHTNRIRSSKIQSAGQSSSTKRNNNIITPYESIIQTEEKALNTLNQPIPEKNNENFKSNKETSNLNTISENTQASAAGNNQLETQILSNSDPQIIYQENDSNKIYFQQSNPQTIIVQDSEPQTIYLHASNPQTIIVQESEPQTIYLHQNEPQTILLPPSNPIVTFANPEPQMQKLSYLNVVTPLDETILNDNPQNVTNNFYIMNESTARLTNNDYTSKSNSKNYEYQIKYFPDRAQSGKQSLKDSLNSEDENFKKLDVSKLNSIPVYLCLSIIATILCPICGIIALCFSCKAKKNLQNRQYANAYKSGLKAKGWSYGAIGTNICIAIILAIIVCIVFGLLAYNNKI